MKRLLTAIAVAVAVLTASAVITDTQDFEGNSFDALKPSVFRPSVADEDSSSFLAYGENEQPALEVPPFGSPTSDFGSQYLSLDTGDATLWRTNADEAAYFDMALKFTPTAAGDEPTPGEQDKILVYMDADTNIVVISGTAANDTTPVTNTVTTAGIEANEWARLSISATQDRFLVYVNGTSLNGDTGYYSLASGTTIKEVGFSGCGALDNFVARTTDPHIQNPPVKIGVEGYASLDAALDDLANFATPTNVTLYVANLTTTKTLAADQSYYVNTKGLAFGGFAASGDTALKSSTDANGITRYYGVEGVAAIADWQGNNPVWYESFNAAYDRAAANSASQSLIVKIDSNFTPGNIQTSKRFWNVTFTTTSEEPLRIVASNGNVIFRAVNAWTFPSNATLVMPYSQTVTTAGYTDGNKDICTVSGGIVEIPAGVTISMAAFRAFDNVSDIVGAGTIVTPSNPWDFLASSKVVTEQWLTNSTWAGTLEFGGSCTTRDTELAKLGNAASTIRFNGYTASKFDASDTTYDFNVELVGDGLTLNCDATRVYHFGGALIGSGALNVAQAGNNSYFYFSGDVSRFSGSVANAGASTRIVFGANSTTANGQAIVVAPNTSVTNGVGTTWASYNLVLLGELVVNGDIVVTNKCIWGNDGKGVIRFNDKTKALGKEMFANSWNGTYVVGWSTGGETDNYLNPNLYADSGKVVALAADFDDKGYFGTGSAGTLTIAPTIRLDADVTIKNGFSKIDDTCLVTFTKLTGDHSLTTSQGYDSEQTRRYAITTLDAFSGTLNVSANSSIKIDTVNVAEAPAAGACVVKATVGTGGSVDAGYPTLKVANAANGRRLVYNGSAATPGLYVATIQSDVDYYLSIADAIADSKTTVTLLAASAEDVTLPAGGSIVTGGFAYTGTATTAEGYRVAYDEATGTYTSSAIPYVAQVGATKYETLKDAVDAATAGQTVVVLTNCEVTAPIEFRYGITLSNDYTITTKADYSLRMRNGTSSPVTICGTGAIAWDAGAGSPVMVGNNETNGAKVTSYGYVADDLYSGYLVLESGTIRTGAIAEKKGNMIKVESGTFVMNGGAITGHPTRCIKADAENGDATATVIINGGVISNSLAESKSPIVFNAAQDGNGSATVTINGGQITGKVADSNTGTVTIPGNSTAQFDRDQTAFCEAGYGTKQSGDWFVVTPMYAITFVSGESSVVTNVFAGDLPVAPEAAAIVGKTFSGWTPTIVAATEATTYTAQYDDITYTVTVTGGANATAAWTVNGSTVGTPATLTHGDTYSVTFTADSGYKFADGGTTTNFSGTATAAVVIVAPDAEAAGQDIPEITPSAGGEAAQSYTESDATAITNAINNAKATYIKAPTGVTGKNAEDYSAMFEAKVVSNGEGGYKVVVELTETAKAEVQSATNDNAAEVIEDLSESDVELTTKPGLYYSFKYGTTLGGMTEGDRTLATGTTTTLTRPTTENATAGFYKVLVNTAPKPAPAAD